MVKHKEQIEEILEYYSSRPNAGSQENLVAMLREIQETEGCIPGEIQREAADRLGVKESVLACLVKLYPTLKPAPYCHELVLCTGERCGKKDSLEILHAVKKRLKPGKDGISCRPDHSSGHQELSETLFHIPKSAAGRSSSYPYDEREDTVPGRKNFGRKRRKHMRYEAILFDLDGTLTASGEGITKSVQYALKKMGREEQGQDLKQLEVFVGPPLLEQFMKFCGISRGGSQKGSKVLQRTLQCNRDL